MSAAVGLATAAARPQAAAGEGSRRQAARAATRTALLPRRLAAVPQLLPRRVLSVAPSRRALALPVRAQQEQEQQQQQQQQPPLPNLPPDTLPADFAECAAEAKESLQGTSIYLVGMMGSGKSTVGKIVGQALRYSFFDTDTLIQQLTGSTIPQIFEEDGEEAFRVLETQVLHELMPFKECVVATGGGIVTRAMNWGHMQHGIVIWLSGSPELLVRRVVGDGTESRPLLSQGQEGAAVDEHTKTLERLTRLLEERRKQYEFADIVVPLEGEDGEPGGAPVGVVAYRVLDAIRNRIKSDAEMREDRKNFTIEYSDPADIPTMQVMQSPVGASEFQDDPHLP